MTHRTIIEFFAGIGLVHEAIKPFGWKTVFANDNNHKKIQAYNLNFPETHVSDHDIRKLDIGDIPVARLATASFPCIDLSQAGGREGINGEKSSVVWAFLDHIAALKRVGKAPEFLFLENVPGLLSLHGGRSIDILLHRIAELGYSFDLVQVDALHFLPQTRNRVFIIAVEGKNRFKKPQTIPDVTIRRYKVKEAYVRNPNLPWFFFAFPKSPMRKIQLKDVIEPLACGDSRWWEEEKIQYFWSHLERHHGPKLKGLQAQAGLQYVTAVRRGRRRGVREQIINVRFDGVASCLRTPQGGSSTQFIVEIKNHDVRVRKILGIEAARLQGVKLPTSSPQFQLYGSETDQLFGFGDAVCVPVVRWLFEHTIEKIINDSLVPIYTNLELAM